MAITLVALTLLYLAIALFGPAQPGSAEQTAALSVEPAATQLVAIDPAREGVIVLDPVQAFVITAVQAPAPSR